MKTGIEIIAEERQRQIDVEGWTPEHDDTHVDGELAMAASVYAEPTDQNGKSKRVLRWPWEMGWFKPAKDKSIDERIKELAKSGSMAAAEIDRLQRK